MEIVKFILVKFCSGLLIGLGLFIAMTAVTYGMMFFGDDIQTLMVNESSEGKCHSLKHCEADSALEIEVIRERIEEDQFILFGKLHNKGSHSWSSAKIRAELFDKEKVFFEECEEFIDRKIPPNSFVNFKLACSECSKPDLTSYGSYEVSLVDANTFG